MLNLDFYETIFFYLMIFYGLIRIFYSKHRFTTKYKKTVNYYLEKFNSSLVSLGVIVFPLASLFFHCFEGFKIKIPEFLRIISSIILFFDVIFFYFIHKQLAENWSPYLEIKIDQKLITNGIYKYIRHPMYTQLWIWVIFQGLILSNYFIEIIGILTWGNLYFMRVSNEEKMMIDEFGDDYKKYMKKTGRLFPKLNFI